MAWYNSDFGWLTGMGIFALGLSGALRLCPESETTRRLGCGREEAPIIQQQVVGNEQPDLCIIRDDVAYCSQVDGIGLSELVNAYHQQEGQRQ